MQITYAAVSEIFLGCGGFDSTSLSSIRSVKKESLPVADDTPDFYEDKVDEVYSFVIDNASVKVDIPTK